MPLPALRPAVVAAGLGAAALAGVTLGALASALGVAGAPTVVEVEAGVTPTAAPENEPTSAPPQPAEDDRLTTTVTVVSPTPEPAPSTSPTPTPSQTAAPAPAPDVHAYPLATPTRPSAQAPSPTGSPSPTPSDGGPVGSSDGDGGGAVDDATRDEPDTAQG